MGKMVVVTGKKKHDTIMQQRIVFFLNKKCSVEAALRDVHTSLRQIYLLTLRYTTYIDFTSSDLTQEHDVVTVPS